MKRRSFFVCRVFAMGAARLGRAGARDVPEGVAFELNQGQVDPSVKFVARAGGYRLFLTADAAVLAAFDGKRADTLAMRLLQANHAPIVSGVDQQAGGEQLPEGLRSSALGDRR